MNNQEYLAMRYDTAYRAASLLSQQLQSWRPVSGSATKDYNVGEQKTLIARCRDAYRNQPLARAAVDRLEQQIVGSGITMQSTIDSEILGISKEETMQFEQQIERLFEIWCSYCDWDGQLSFAEICQMLVSSWLVSGDIFLNTPFENKNYIGLRLQVVESDRICNPYFAPDTASLRAGVELESGRVIAYHVMNWHPYDNVVPESWEWQRYSTIKNRFFHLWKKERPGQVRGVPFLAPVLEQMAQLDRYTEAELQATVVASLLSVFIKSEGGGGLRQSGYEQKDNDIALKPGAIIDLLPGEDISTVSPGRPNRGFDSFVEACYKQIGAGLGVPMESLLLRFDSSYSAARAAMAMGWRKVQQMRSTLINRICLPVYSVFFDEIVARNLIEHKSLEDYWENPLVRNAWQKARWSGPARGAIDEEKEIRAAEKRIMLGVSTIQKESEEMGTGDWLDLHRQREREHFFRVEANLEPEILLSSKGETNNVMTEEDAKEKK